MKEAIIVTGASTGLGRAILERLAGEGATVINLDATPPGAEAPGVFLQVDLSDEAATAAALAELCSRFAVTRLVNHAPAAPARPCEELSVAELDTAITRDLATALLCVNAALPAMRERRFGRIVNVSSAMVTGRAHHALDGMTKGGLVALTRTWALELARHGITVNTVAPGAIDRGPAGHEAEGAIPGNEWNPLTIPAGRLGRPEEVAQAVSFFLDARTDFVTGQLLFVCGGQTLGVQPA
jgi:3-oxoacyl-[acyl-carrier protein] reductase